MAKKSTNKSWVNRLREWEDQASAPLPPSGDWDRLANKMALEEKRKKKGAAYWWWLGLALVSCSLLLIYLLSSHIPSQEAIPPVPIALQQQQEVLQQSTQNTAAANTALDASQNDSPPVRQSIKLAPRPLKEIQIPDAPAIKNKMPDQASKHGQAREAAVHFAVITPPNDTDLLPDSKNARAIPSLATITPSPLFLEAKLLSLPSFHTPVLPTSADLNQAERKKWAIGPTLMLAQNSLSASNNSSGLRPISRSQQQGLHSGLALSAKLGSRWGLQLGINRGKEEVSSRYRFQRIYTLNDERTTAAGEVVNNFSVDLEGKYAKTAADVEISRTPNQLPALQNRLLIEARLEEKITITQIPLLLTYDLPLGNRFSLRLGTGVNWQQNQITTEQQARLVQPGRFQLRRSRVLSRESFVEESLWMGQASLGLHYQLAERCAIIGQTNAYSSIGKANATEVLNYNAIGGQVQLLYHF